ncbi:MAG: acyl-CoA dehydrogenase family protein [Acidobacteriota bacterium]|nr:acyl-CoA dehydrogenase family protein [Acidobacteriota bacterium]
MAVDLTPPRKAVDSANAEPKAGNGRFLIADTAADAVFTREDLSEEQLLFGRAAEEFMRTEVLPRVKELYNHDWVLTRELIQKAADRDFTRLEIPEAYGGLGLDKVSTASVGEMLSLDPSFAGSLGAHTSIGTLPIVYFGNEDQRARYLPRLASGELIGAFALTEPEAGSDALSARMTATLTADGKFYSLRGQKLWITNGAFADIFTVFAKIDGQHFTAFIVERGMGVVSGADEHKLGLDGSSTTALMFDDVKVPVENVLGTIGEGHKVAFNTLNFGRVKLGTRNIGGAKQALTAATRYAKERRQFGQAVSSFGLIKHKIAEIAIRCFVGDAMVFRSLGEVDRALAAVDPNDVPAVLKTIEEFAVECSINKVWTSEALAYAVDEALQIYGGNGYSQEFPAERAYRDARITRIYEGTNEINRLIIGTRLAKSTLVGPVIATAADRGLEGGDKPLGLSDERGLLARAKRITAFALGRASKKYGKGLGSEQEVVGRLADMAIEVYALESAILRSEKMQVRGGSHAATAADIAQVFAADAADRLEQAAKNALASIEGPDAAATIDRVHALLHHGPVNTIAARRRIADAVIEANRYPL